MGVLTGQIKVRGRQMALTTPSLGRTRTFYFLPITPIPLVHRGVLTTDAPFVGQAVTGTLSGASISIQP